MINCLLSLFLIFSSYTLFGFSKNYFGIHRVFLSINSAVFYESIVAEYTETYILEDAFRHCVIEYFTLNLESYTNEFELGFFYYDYDEDYINSNKCNGVKVTLSAQLQKHTVYKKTFKYLLEKIL